MKKKTLFLTSLMLITALLMTGFTSQIVQAEEAPEELELEGIVQTVDEDGFTFLTEDDILVSVSKVQEQDGSYFFTLTVGEDDPLTIPVEEGFDFGEIEEGGEFELELKYDEEAEEWTVYKHKFQKQEEEQEREREEEGPSLQRHEIQRS